MQALTMHDVGALGEKELSMLAELMMHRAAALAQTQPDAASAVVFQLLPPVAR